MKKEYRNLQEDEVAEIIKNLGCNAIEHDGNTYMKVSKNVQDGYVSSGAGLIKCWDAQKSTDWISENGLIHILMYKTFYVLECDPAKYEFTASLVDVFD